MNRQDFTSLMTQARQRPGGAMDKTQLESLGEIVREFPYFQAARALYLKEMKDNDSIRYNRFLKETAAHTADRSVLFEYITSQHFLKKQEPATGAKRPSVRQLADGTSPQPLFSKDTAHSFSEWLKLTAAKPIVREEPAGQENPGQAKKFRLIEAFLREKPKIDPKTAPEGVSDEDLTNSFGAPDKSLMTETLAELYVQQKKYKKALKAYKILGLKNPEKSGYFADRIRAVEKEQAKED